MSARTAALANSAPIDAGKVAAFQATSYLSEFEVLTGRGISFPYRTSLRVHWLWAAFMAAFVALGLAGAVRDFGSGKPPGSALALAALFAVLLIGVWRDWSRRNDRLVIDDRSLELWRGPLKLTRIAWSQLDGVSPLAFGYVRLSGSNGVAIWISERFTSAAFLRSFAAWVPGLKLHESFDGSLRRAVERAMQGPGLVFKFHWSDVVRWLGQGAFSVAFGAVVLWSAGHCEQDPLWTRMAVGSLGVLSIAASLYFFRNAQRAVARRRDRVTMFATSLKSSGAKGDIFIGWAEMAQVDAVRRFRIGKQFYACDPLGRRVIDDEPGFRFRIVARVLLQFMLFREMTKQGSWAQVRALDSLKL